MSEEPTSQHPAPQDAESPGEEIRVPDDGLGEWPTHGGPLGCLLSTLFGFILAGFVSASLFGGAFSTHNVVKSGFIVAAIVVLVAIVIVFGIVGWGIGKLVYREYAPSKRQIRYAERMQREALKKGPA
jgi:type IV secretory pathway TrbD component